MKSFFLSFSIWLFVSLVCAQDSPTKPAKHFLQVQVGLGTHQSLFSYKGEYAAVGYKYKFGKFLYLNSRFTLLNAKEGSYKKKKWLTWPTLQVKSWELGTSAELNFFKRHSIEGGVNLTIIMLTKSIGLDIMAEHGYYEPAPFHLTKFGANGFAAYYFRVNSKTNAGVLVNKTFISDSRYNKILVVDTYGLLLQLSL